MPLAGALVRASDIRNPVVYFKAASESVTSNATAQNDDDIAIALDVGLWGIDLFGVATGAQAADVIVQWTFSGTATLRHRSGTGPGTNTTDIRNTDSVQRAGMSLTTGPGYGTDANTGDRSSRIHERLVIEVTVAGTLQLQWAQAVSTASATAFATATHAEVQQLEEL